MHVVLFYSSWVIWGMLNWYKVDVQQIQAKLNKNDIYWMLSKCRMVLNTSGIYFYQQWLRRHFTKKLRPMTVDQHKITLLFSQKKKILSEVSITSSFSQSLKKPLCDLSELVVYIMKHERKDFLFKLKWSIRNYSKARGYLNWKLWSK